MENKYPKTFNEFKLMLESQTKKILPELAVVKFDETSEWQDKIAEKAGKIEGYYLADLSQHVNLAEITPSIGLYFLYNRFQNTKKFDEYELTELESENGGEDFMYVPVNAVENNIVKMLDVDKEELEEAVESEEDYNDFIESKLDYLRGNPIEGDYIRKKVNETLKEQGTNETSNKIVDLLKMYGFKQSSIPNEFVNGKRYKAIVWVSNIVTITKYTQNYGQFLHSNTYENIDTLEKELQNNHYNTFEGDYIKKKVNEISSNTFKNAIDISKERGTDKRTHTLSKLFFDKFIGDDFYGGKIDDITVFNPKQGRYKLLTISYSYFDEKLKGIKKGNIGYDVDKDLYNINFEINRKDALLLSKIAQHINPETKYKNIGENFDIIGYR